MLTLRIVRGLCAAFDTIALTAIAAAISKSKLKARSEFAPFSSFPPHPNPARSARTAAASATSDISDLPAPSNDCCSLDRKPSVEPALVRLKKERDPEELFRIFRANAHNRLVVENRFAFEDTVSRLGGARRYDLIEQLLEHQKSLPQGRREGFMVRIIMLYGKAGMPDHSLRTFYQMHLFGCRRTVKSFNATLRVLALSRRVEDLQTLVEDGPLMFNILLDQVSYNLVVNFLCDMGRLEAAYSTMVEMTKAGIEPDVVTYTTLISASYKHNLREVGDGIWNLMVLRGCSPNLATFNVRIQFLVNKWRASKANHLARRMVTIGVEPDHLTYNLLIKGFGMVGDLEMAKRIFFSIHKRGCEPNGKIYQTMIHYLCKGGDFNLAFKLCKASMKNNWFPSIDSISQLLEGLMTIFKDKNAWEIMQLVRGRIPPYSREEIELLLVKLPPQVNFGDTGCEPDVAALNNRILYLVNESKVWKAHGLMKEMTLAGVQPNQLTYSLLIKGFCMTGHLDMAKKTFFSIRKQGCKPNAEIYCTMLYYLCREGDFDFAFKLCKGSMRNGWFPSIDLITQLLEGLTSISKDKNARDIMTFIREEASPYSAEEVKALQAKLSPQMGIKKTGFTSF